MNNQIISQRLTALLSDLCLDGLPSQRILALDLIVSVRGLEALVASLTAENADLRRQLGATEVREAA